MRKFPRSIVVLSRDGGPNTHVSAEGTVGDDRFVHKWFTPTAAVVAAVDKIAPS